MVTVVDSTPLTSSISVEVQHTVIKSCGWLAALAATEALDTTLHHGKNHTCELIDNDDYMLLVLESDCPDGKHRSEAGSGDRDSIIGGLCRQGVVMYYYHTIYHRHHRVCLALRKRDSLTVEEKAAWGIVV